MVIFSARFQKGKFEFVSQQGEHCFPYFGTLNYNTILLITILTGIPRVYEIEAWYKTKLVVRAQGSNSGLSNDYAKHASR